MISIDNLRELTANPVYQAASTKPDCQPVSTAALDSITSAELSAQVLALQEQVARQAKQLDQMQEGHVQLTKLVQSVGTMSRLVLSAVNQLK
jgi:hypothetical protein